MTVPEAAGQRFCCAIEFSWIGEVADALAERFGPEGWKVPTRKLPSFLVRVFALFDPTVRVVVSDLGRVRNVSSARIRDVRLDRLPEDPAVLRAFINKSGDIIDVLFNIII